MSAVLEKEYKYYTQNKRNILKKYDNRYIVIVGNEVIGGYSSQGEALFSAAQKYPVGTFFVHHVTKGDEVQKFHSRLYVD
jgi:hypothetical protein